MIAQHPIFQRFGEDAYENAPKMYKSLKNVGYIYKSSLFGIMYRLFVQPIAHFKSPLAHSLLVFYLKNLESRFQNNSELIELPTELVVKTAKSLQEIDLNVYISHDDDDSTIFEGCQMMLKDCGAEFSNSELSAIMTPVFEKFPVKRNRKMYREIISVIAYVFSHLENFYITFFLPKNPKVTFKPVIRLFSNKDTYLVMANEVMENLKKQKIDVSSLEEEVSTMSPYGTWNFRELAGKVDMKNIEFVKIPLDLSETHCSIPTSDGGFISAARILGKSEEPTSVNSETRTLPVISEENNTQSVSSDSNDAFPIEESISEPTSSFEGATSSTTVEPASESLLDSTSPATEPSINQKKQKKTKKSKKQNTPKEVQPESNTCPKCIRSSEYSRATNEKLRISKVENKHMKKNLAAVEMENIEQKEIIEMLKKKLQEKEEELQKKNTVIEVLEAEKEVMQQENQENKQKIQGLEQELQTAKPTTSTTSTQTMEQPTMVIDFSENKKDGLFILLNVRNTLKTENPIKKIREVAGQLCEKSHDRQTQIAANCEVKLFERKANFYINAVDSHIKWVLAQSDLPSSWDPCLPEFPGFSQKFLAAYETILKSDPPKICETLLKAPLEELEDKECVICSDDMDSYEGTLKCEHCKRRYHDGCAKKWFKVNRTCPMCRESMMDEDEFPQLSR